MKLAQLCYRTLDTVGLTALARRLTRRPLVLCYHNVVRTPDTSGRDGFGLHMSLDAFESQLTWLTQRYDVVSLAELENRRSKHVSLHGLAVVTFDDAYGGVFENAWPLLNERRLPATVFVVAGAPGRNEDYWWDDPDVRRSFSPSRLEEWLTVQRGDGGAIVQTLERSAARSVGAADRRAASWETITAAARQGLDLGAHSMTHRSLPALDYQELEHEVVASREIIRARTGVTPQFFAYPYGLWNERVRQAVQSAGYRGAVTLEHGKKATITDPWSLPRMNVPASIPPAAFHAWAAGLNLRRGSKS